MVIDEITTTQLSLLEPEPGPDLTSYDIILVNSSAGKDSQATLDYVAELAGAAGVLDRVIVAHADLGRVEWEGSLELAGRQAAHYGVRFEVVRNRNWRDLLERIESNGMWPGAKTRYCTSEFKTGQVKRLTTQLVDELLASGRVAGRPVRVLSCLGIRAAESPGRARKLPFQQLGGGWSNGKRHVDLWYPIHDWSLAEVWARIEQSGVEHHRAYDLGMPRLSCVFCVFASKSALTLAAQHNPELAREYAEVEARMGHTFRQELSMSEIVRLASETPVKRVEDWSA